ncbi:MAG TPA: hypothetical protein VGR24_08065 [bacterium]|jgi:hypothetical protein|nr:hypothetical protein [bacterium]
MKRKVLIAVIALVVIGVGALAYFKLRPRAAAQAQQDPALAIAIALTALERSESHQLTDEQIRTVLPLLRVLRDTDPNETEVSRALVASIRKVLTPEQLAALEEMRQEAQARRDQGGVPGPQRPRRGPGGPGVGPGGPGAPGLGPGAATPEARAAFRRQARQALLSRLIRRLENRL